jgi:hypothetical protein
MDSLAQYNGIRRGSLRQVAYVTSSVGSAPANPPNPFSDSDVSNLIDALCKAGRVSTPFGNDQLFYCVVMPQGVASTSTSFIGEHSFSTISFGFPIGDRIAHWAWVTNNGTLASVTTIFSHELVEACTDPEGDGFTGTVCSQPGLCEIGDVCTTTAIVDGVTVQRYWSNFDGQCVVPTDAIVKTDKDTKDAKDKDKDTKDRKDRKDRKETKDGKEKEKDAKEKDRDRISSDASIERLVSRIDDLASRISAIEERGDSPSFIEPAERPNVGGSALARDEN